MHPLAAAGDQRGRTLARGTQQVGLRAATSSPVLWRHCRSLPFRKSGELTEAEKSPSCSHGLGQGLSTLHSGHSELGHPLLWGCPRGVFSSGPWVLPTGGQQLPGVVTAATGPREGAAPGWQQARSKGVKCRSVSSLSPCTHTHARPQTHSK